MCFKRMVGIAIGAIAMLAMAVPALTQEVFTVTTVIQVPPSSTNTAGTFFSFDISWVEPALGKYFVTDRNNKAIDVIDTSNPRQGVSQQFFQAFAGFTGNNDTSGPDGVLTVPQPDGTFELWIGDSNPNCASPPCAGSSDATTPGTGRVWILDATTGANVFPSPIQVGGNTRADELCFDANDRVIMIASPAESPPYVTFISTGNGTFPKGQILGQLFFDGTNAPNATNGIEQCGWSPITGKFYQNVPEVNGPGNDTAPGQVAVINPTTFAVENTFTVPLDACAGPQGMVIGPNNQILLGCNARGPDGHRNTAIIDATSGAVLAVIPDLGGADQVNFNPGDGNYIIPSCNTPCRTVPVPGATTGPQVLGIVNSNGFVLDQVVTVSIQNSDTNVTSGNPRTIHSAAGDPTTRQIFLPIPACPSATSCGNVPHFNPTLCNVGLDVPVPGVVRVGNPSTATGCIVVLAPVPQ